MGTIEVDGATLAYELHGGGLSASGSRRETAPPFVFQHGMGGNIEQPKGYVGDRVSRECVFLAARGHTPSTDLAASSASFDAFADDVVALADHLGLPTFAVGGISLGAGTALNLALRYPTRVSALVLCRPAWLDQPLPDFNRAAYREIADILDDLLASADDELPTADEVDEAAARYQEESAIYRQVASEAPAAAASLVGQITRPRAVPNSLLLRALPADRPTGDRALWTDIAVPTLVIGHRDDRFHPYSVAEAYADSVPGAELVTVPSKDADSHGFVEQTRAALDTFLATA